MLADAHDVDGRLAEVSGPVGGGDNNGSPAVGDEAAVQEVEGPGDITRGLVVFQGQGIALVGVGVLGGPASCGNGHGAELLAGGPELGHVTLGDHGVAAGGTDHAVSGVGADGSAVGARIAGEGVVAVAADGGSDETRLDGHHCVLD